MEHPNLIDSIFFKLPTIIRALIVLSITALIVIGDISMPPYVAFTGYYFIPLFLSIWYFNHSYILAITFTSSILGRFFVVSTDLPKTVYWWETLIGLGSISLAFIIFCYVVIKLKTYILELNEQANQDVLTNLNSRRHFLTLAEYELKKKIRQPSPLSVVMLDIDFFKRLNDTQGHDVGDSLLVDFSKCLATSLRNIDIIGRLGGDEFAIILPDTSYNETRLVLRRLHSQLKKVFESYHCERLGCSIGAINLKSGVFSEDINELLRQADVLMYQVKNTKKNDYLVKEI